MKKTVPLILALLMLLSGCGAEKSEEVTPSPEVIIVSPPPAAETVFPEVPEESPAVPEASATPEPTPTPEPKKELKITKDPSGETVNEGATTWFVARAENADSISWEFLSPDGNVHSLTETMSINSGLKLEEIGDDTIQLSSIPLSLSGWKCRAVFTGQGMNLTTAAADITVKTVDSFYYPLYSSVIDNYRALKNGGADTYGLATDLDMSSELRYCLNDMDGDGVPELLIGCPESAGGYPWTAVIYSMFRLVDNKPVKVFQSTARDRYLPSTVGILHEGSSGAENSICYLEHYSGGAITASEGIYTTSDGYFRVAGGTAETGVSEAITADQYQSYYNWYQQSIYTLVMSAFR